jgi:hypothetical protein
MMPPTAMPIDWPALAATCAVNSAVISRARDHSGTAAVVAAMLVTEPMDLAE